MFSAAIDDYLRVSSCLLINPPSSKLYKLGGELGKGGFGVVYAAVRRSDKLQVKGLE